MSGVVVLRAVLAAVILASCGPRGLQVIPRSELPDVVYGSPRPSISPPPLPPNGIVYFVRKGRLFPVTQTLQPVTQSLHEALLLSLLAGPAEAEGARTAIPEGTRLNGVGLDATVATVDLSGDFEPGSPRSQVLRVAQVVFTLTEPGTGIHGVRFAIDGVLQETIEGVRPSPGDRAVTRLDYAEFAPSPEATGGAES